ncbi:hypothetical protein TIFTF001_026629 [Ficus carica]|uniref:Uncharacterized protein n=1 Tax=Ficus carica TaxID=3494 RepID=A0AA88DLG0_FICCA|nr:hypothetical protein TIFTF001_026629 [Ficus carica]
MVLLRFDVVRGETRHFSMMERKGQGAVWMDGGTAWHYVEQASLVLASVQAA